MERFIADLTTKLAYNEALADLDVLNYALTLEHLEAALYREAIASGRLQGRILQLFQSFGGHEATHVTALVQTIQQLGGTPVQAQARYYPPMFNTANDMVTFFQTVEEVGAAAYLGAAPQIQSPQVLEAAVSIHNVEGQHAAVLADYLGLKTSPVVAKGMTTQEVLAIVTPFLTGAAMPGGMPRTGLGGGAGMRGSDYPVMTR